MGYVYIGFNKTPVEVPVVATTTPTETITVAHAYKDGEHRFIGQVKLPDSCYAFNAEAIHDQKRQNVIIIVLNASDKKINQSQCSQLPTFYPFQVLSDGAEDSIIEAKLNGEKINLNLKTTEWQSSTGTYFNPISN